MAVDRAQLLLVGLPLFLFCSDVFNLFAPAPPKPATHHHRIPPSQTPAIQQPLDFPAQVSFVKLVSLRFDIRSSTSYTIIDRYTCLRSVLGVFEDMAVDRAQLLLVGLPLFLFCSDVFNLFAPAPPKPATHHHRIPPSQTPVIQQPLDFPAQKTGGFGGGIGLGNTVQIDFCASCSYRVNRKVAADQGRMAVYRLQDIILGVFRHGVLTHSAIRPVTVVQADLTAVGA
ncbi:hypothetical protein E3N88_31702 [Mikania micrantha]|uniref:Yippee domain-containing protein n=1 Tax=Mikania micrantha TaxID=192012 RepID=A0A5N6M745_9ASTR|nr:hypothetical protein E3N88_31702 [Mikania micrantha]